MSKLSRFLVPSTVACVLLAALAFAATASAEVRTGEGSSPVNLAIPGEADLLHASASYDSHTGTVVFDTTAREAPAAQPKAVPRAVLFTVKGACDASVPAAKEPLLPTLTIGRSYEEAKARWIVGWSGLDAAGEPLFPGLGSWSLEGTTGTLAATAEPAVGQPYNCALVEIAPPSGPVLESGEYVFLPLSAPKPVEPVEPAKAADPVVKTVTVSPPPPAPAKLSIAKSKALNAKAGKWVTAGVKVTNGGGTAAGPIAIRAKAPAGVTVKSGRLKLPALLPGQSWTVSIRMKLGADAKPSSTIAVSATGPGLSADGSLVVKRQG